MKVEQEKLLLTYLCVKSGDAAMPTLRCQHLLSHFILYLTVSRVQISVYFIQLWKSWIDWIEVEKTTVSIIECKQELRIPSAILYSSDNIVQCIQFIVGIGSINTSLVFVRLLPYSILYSIVYTFPNWNVNKLCSVSINTD